MSLIKLILGFYRLNISTDFNANIDCCIESIEEVENTCYRHVIVITESINMSSSIMISHDNRTYNNNADDERIMMIHFNSSNDSNHYKDYNLLKLLIIINIMNHYIE